MRKERTKMRAFIMSLIMLVGLLFPMGADTTNVKAETVAASIDEIRTDKFVKGEVCFVYVYLKDTKEGAQYTLTTSDKTTAEYCCCRANKDTMYFKIYEKKAGTFSVTVKEIYNGRTVVVGTESVSVTEKKPGIYWNYLSHESVDLEKGAYTAIGNLEKFIELVDVKSKNPAVAKITTISGRKVVQGKKVGKTSLVFKYNDADGEENTTTMEIRVVERSNDTTAKELRAVAKKINEYCRTKVTKKNAKTLLKNIVSLDADEWYEYEAVPTIYTQEDLEYTKNLCKFVLGMNVNKYGISLEAVSITKLTANTITLKLNHAVSEAEMFAIDESYPIIVHDADERYYYFYANVKKGAKELVGKVQSSYYSLEKGETYHVYTFQHKASKVKTLSKKY